MNASSPYSSPGGFSTSMLSTPHFEVKTLEYLKSSLNFQRERLTVHEIIWFKEVSGDVIIDSRPYALKKNVVYCLSPGQLRDYRIAGDATGYQLSFSSDFLHINASNNRIASWLDSIGSDSDTPALEADAEMQEEMEMIITKMKYEYANYYLLRSEILSGLLNILMIHLSRKLHISGNDFACSKDADLVRRFKLLLKKQFTSKKMVTDYASELFVTPNYLNRTVKKVTGFTASHHIQQCIIMEAKRQAAHANVSMKEIAYFLGFDNLAHFSKFFKNNSGMNFSSFKKELQYAL